MTVEISCIFKSICTYTRHTVRYRYACKALAIIESPKTYTRHTPPVNHLRNFNLFCTAAILCNFHRTIIKHVIPEIPIRLSPCAHRTDYNHRRKGHKTQQPLFKLHIISSLNSVINKQAQPTLNGLCLYYHIEFYTEILCITYRGAFKSPPPVYINCNLASCTYLSPFHNIIRIFIRSLFSTVYHYFRLLSSIIQKLS